MAWDEWEQLKSAAAGHRTAAAPPAQRPPGTHAGADPERLRSQKRAWTGAGQAVKRLRTDITRAMVRLESGQTGLTPLPGCRSGVAQQELHASWTRYLADVRTRCGELGALLEQAGRDLSMTDAALRDELGRIQVRYADTAAPGGRAKTG
ncbi:MULTISPECIES: hypothetical protein [unclassified Streptomyces]|uniref:hypothetical protein n=1 Tax=unclassified Streptomyces TaxID=2593676 RepID=UPI00331C7A17